MKKMTEIAVIYFILIISLLLCTELPATARDQSRSLLPPENLLQFDFRYSYFDYKEDIDPPLKSTEQGWLPGGVISWTRKKPQSLYSRALVELSGGDIEYDGTTQTGRPISSSDSNQLFFRFEFNLGYSVPWGEWLIVPYTGYGYRYWKRGDSETDGMVAFVREDYSWHYIPVGIRAFIPLGERLSIEPHAAARFMFGGKMTAYLTDIDPNYSDDPTFNLGNKPGWYVEMPLRYALDGNWSLALTPWYEYSAIGKSGVERVRYGQSMVRGFYEPSSTTHQYGFNLGVGYSF